MNILLIAPYFENEKYPLYLPSENLGIAYLASSLRKFDHNVELFDANIYQIKSIDILTHINPEEYDLIGISASFQLLIEDVKVLSYQFKKQSNDVHITVGGHYPTFMHKEILNKITTVDSVIRGDGEETILKLLQGISNDKYSDILNLTYREGTNIKVNNKSDFLVLDKLEWPARDSYEALRLYQINCPIQLTTSRGCFGNCSFCDIKSFYNGKWRCRDYEDVVDEIEFLNRKYHAKTFRLTDDEFIGPRPKGSYRAKQIANEIIKRGLDIELMISARAQDVEVELFSLLKRAGVKDCLIGIESGVDRILKLYNKGNNVKDNLDCIKILKSLDIDLNLVFIMFDPRMTYDELLLNYDFLHKNELITIDSLKSWFWPLYGTDEVQQLESENLIVEYTLSEIKYKFKDAMVNKVFLDVQAFSEATFGIEKLIYGTRLSNIDITSINEEYRELWITAFEAIIKTNTKFYICSYEQEISKIEQSLKKLTDIKTSKSVG